MVVRILFMLLVASSAFAQGGNPSSWCCVMPSGTMLLYEPAPVVVGTIWEVFEPIPNTDYQAGLAQTYPLRLQVLRDTGPGTGRVHLRLQRVALADGSSFSGLEFTSSSAMSTWTSVGFYYLSSPVMYNVAPGRYKIQTWVTNTSGPATPAFSGGPWYVDILPNIGLLDVTVTRTSTSPYVDSVGIVRCGVSTFGVSRTLWSDVPADSEVRVNMTYSLVGSSGDVDSGQWYSMPVTGSTLTFDTDDFDLSALPCEAHQINFNVAIYRLGAHGVEAYKSYQIFDGVEPGYDECTECDGYVPPCDETDPDSDCYIEPEPECDPCDPAADCYDPILCSLGDGAGAWDQPEIDELLDLTEQILDAQHWDQAEIDSILDYLDQLVAVSGGDFDQAEIDSMLDSLSSLDAGVSDVVAAVDSLQDSVNTMAADLGAGLDAIGTELGGIGDALDGIADALTDVGSGSAEPAPFENSAMSAELTALIPSPSFDASSVFPPLLLNLDFPEYGLELGNYYIYLDPRTFPSDPFHDALDWGRVLVRVLLVALLTYAFSVRCIRVLMDA